MTLRFLTLAIVAVIGAACGAANPSSGPSNGPAVLIVTLSSSGSYTGP